MQNLKLIVFLFYFFATLLLQIKSESNGTLETYTLGFGTSEEEWRGDISLLSWNPRAFLLKNFLSDAECDHFMKLAESTNSDGESKSGTSLLFRSQSAIVKNVESRIAQVSMLPIENQEGFQISYYTTDAKYEAHFDYFLDPLKPTRNEGGQRIMTILLYLNTVKEGGETVFPKGDKKVSGSGWSDCAAEKMAIKPVRGDALMFYNLKADGSVDPATLHGSCPLSQGTKWTATKWIHVSPVAANEASSTS